MDNIIHNVSLIILIFGIIMVTIYITRATKSPYMTRDEMMIKQLKNKYYSKNTSIYDARPNKIFRRMFTQPSIWQGYQKFDPKESMTKIFIKTTSPLTTDKPKDFIKYKTI